MSVAWQCLLIRMQGTRRVLHVFQLCVEMQGPIETEAWDDLVKVPPPTMQASSTLVHPVLLSPPAPCTFLCDVNPACVLVTHPGMPIGCLQTS